MVTADDFTIGWICALPIELHAATSLLDEIYPPLPPHGQDTNAYVVGRVAQHRVVIACLPVGNYGTISVAKVASGMLRTFRSIRMGLLVGIGGGAPSLNHDIRLGDVVVGLPDGGRPGVVQFDLGKASGDGRLPWIGALNRPPTALSMACAKLEAQHMLEEPRFVEYVAEAAVRHPSEKNIWTRPHGHQDILYSSDYRHPEARRDCSQCDAGHIVARDPRPSTAPQVHYGLIGSSNSVLKSAEVRDRLSQEHGISCFEMEAAGVMHDFPCLVIRGICDYADSHKNDAWQAYAASVSAAYAKELLDCLETAETAPILPAIESLDLDVSDPGGGYASSTSSSTLVDDSDNELINKVAEKVAEVLASSKQLEALYTACASRMTAPMFQRRIVPIMFRYGTSMKKSIQTPLGQALAFVIRRRKELISYSISQRIFGLHSQVAAEVSQYLQMSVEETQRLTDLIKSRFPTSHAQGTQQPHMDEDETEAVEGAEDADPAEETAEMAPSLAEIDLESIVPVLCSGEPFWEAYKQLKSMAFPAPVLELMRVLRRHISSDGSPYAINCLIEWRVFEFMESEGILVTELDSIFTLTGAFDKSAAYRLGDYMHRRWQSGVAVMDAFRELVAAYLSGDKDATGGPGVGAILAPGHEFHIQISPESGGEQALLQIKGNFDQICETLEQFSWLATTLRPSRGKGLTVSEIGFRSVNHSKKLFEVFLLQQSDHRKPDPNEAGQCWTSLFTESNLAYGFSLCDDNRPDEMVGLELPFLVMAAFAGVRHPVDFAGRTVLAGTSTLLTPIVSSNGCIQWHYSQGKDRFDSCRQHVKVPASNLLTTTYKELTAARAFLGFGSNAEILLGTNHGTDISESKAPRTGGKLSMATEGPITMEVSASGFFKLGLGGTWKFSRAGERAQLETQQRTLIDCIQPSQYAPTLLYDYEAARAFLVPELSVILHMVSAYLRAYSSLPRHQIPCAEPCPNSGEAAFRVVEQKQDLPVPFRIGESRKYRDIVHDFLMMWEHRKLQTSARKEEFDLTPVSSIRGWDFVDMQGKQSQFFEREIPTSLLSRKSQPIWWKVFAKQPCMVVFGGNVGCPIRKIAHEPNQPFCNAWADIPTGKQLLLANVSCLTQLITECCSHSQQRDKTRSRHYQMITDELAWARPKGSTLFEPCPQAPGTADSCTPVQTMSKISRWHQWDEAHERRPGDTANYQTGAVLFADDPTDFAPRPCSFVGMGLPVSPPVGYIRLGLAPETNVRAITPHPHIREGSGIAERTRLPAISVFGRPGSLCGASPAA